MKAFVVLSALLACGSAQILLSSGGLTFAGLTHHQVISHGPALLSSVPVAYSAPAVVAPAVTKTQYHSQDELGQASYGHAEPGQAHAAIRDAAGNVRGSYAYINPEGKEIRVEYSAGHGGFQVASNALPVAPTGPPAPAPVALVAPIPVEDTEDVKKAKEEHAKAVQEAVARNAAADKADADKPQSRRKRGIIVAAQPVALAASPVALTYSAPITTVVAAPAVREATLTKVVNTPGHAVSYRVD